MFVCLGFAHFILFVYFFPWPRSSKGPRMGRQFFKNVDLFVFFLGREAQNVREWGVNSLKTSIFPLPTPLRGCRSLLEIVFCRTV